MDFRAIREAAAAGAYVRRSGWIDRVWSRKDGLWWQTSFDQVERVFGAPLIVRADDVTPFDYLATDWTLEPVPELQKGRWEGAPVSVEVEVRHALGAATRFGHRAFLGNKVYLTRRRSQKLYTLEESSELLRYYSPHRYSKREWRYEIDRLIVNQESVFIPGTPNWVFSTPNKAVGFSTFFRQDHDATSPVLITGRIDWVDGIETVTGAHPIHERQLMSPNGVRKPQFRTSGEDLIYDIVKPTYRALEINDSKGKWFRAGPGTFDSLELHLNEVVYRSDLIEELSEEFTDSMLLDLALAATTSFSEELMSSDVVGWVHRGNQNGFERWLVGVGQYRLVAKVPPFESGRYRFVWGVRSPDGLIERFEEEVVPEWQATVCRTAERAFAPSAQVGDFRVVDAAAFWIE